MTWQQLATIQTSADWLLTESVSGSLFRITHNVSGTNVQSLRSVIAQAFDEGVNNTYFDFRRLSFKPEIEAFYFPQPGGLLNRKLAIKRLDNLADIWTVTIEVLDGMPQSISLPIAVSEVIGLQEELDAKELAGAGTTAATSAITSHVAADDPHSQYALDTTVTSVQNTVNTIAGYSLLNVIKNAQSITATNTDVTLTFPTVANDTSNSWNTATNQWTCPVNGTYLININIDAVNNATSNNDFRILVYKNNAVLRRIETNNATPPNFANQLQGFTIPNLVAGDVIDLRIRVSGATTAAPISIGSGGNLYIKRDK